jgi:hypothetical protein
VRYEVGLFAQGDADDGGGCKGHFVHVYVDKRQRVVPVPLCLTI